MGVIAIKEFIDANINLIVFYGLIVNFLTLVLVLMQTKISKDTLIIANQSLIDDKKIREIQMLPKMNFVIHVQIQLETWLIFLQQTREELELAIENDNGDALETISGYGEKIPEGIIDKFMYEHSPGWLSEIYEAGAQYYYACVTTLSSLWDMNEKKGRLPYCDSVIERFNEHIYAIEELLKYIHNTIPLVFLNAPARLSVDNFMAKD